MTLNAQFTQNAKEDECGKEFEDKTLYISVVRALRYAIIRRSNTT